MAFTSGATHMIQWCKQRVKRDGNIKQISKITSKSGLRSATRPHEVGIASNRESAMSR